MNRIDVRVQWLAPGDDAPLFDSARARRDAALLAAPTSSAQLLPGETLQLRKLDGRRGEPLATIKGAAPPAPPASSWMPQAVNDFLGYAVRGLLRRLPVAGRGRADRGHRDHPHRRRQLRAARLRRRTQRQPRAGGGGHARVVVRRRDAGGAGARVGRDRVDDHPPHHDADQALARRHGRRGRRRASPAPAQRWSTLDIADLRSPDELGVLATCLAELLQRVDESMQRERLRAEREKDQWMAVGHEIMSPLQSLIALHGAPDDASRRYILRMQQAIRVLYGSASPSEAFESTTLQLATLDLDAFLAEVAANAPHAGIADVRYDGPGEPVVVRADEYPLEDVITHVLQNAQRHRRAGTPVTLRLRADDARATVELHNEGDADPARADRPGSSSTASRARTRATRIGARRTRAATRPGPVRRQDLHGQDGRHGGGGERRRRRAPRADLAASHRIAPKRQGSDLSSSAPGWPRPQKRRWRRRTGTSSRSRSGLSSSGMACARSTASRPGFGEARPPLGCGAPTPHGRSRSRSTRRWARRRTTRRRWTRSCSRYVKRPAPCRRAAGRRSSPGRRAPPRRPS